MNEKGAVALTDTFSLRPVGFQSRIGEVFTLLAADSDSIRAAIAALEEVVQDTAVLLAGG